MEVRKLYHIGSSLALTLPKYYVKAMKLREGDYMVLKMGDKELNMKPLAELTGPQKQLGLRFGEDVPNGSS